MIKVLQVIEATEGGTRRHVRELAGALDASEFVLRMAVSCGRDPAFRDDVAGYVGRGMGVDEIPMRRRIAPWADFAALVRLILLVRRARPDVIHAHSSKAGALSRLAGVVCGVPVVYTPHGFPFLMSCGRLRLRLYRGVERLLCGAAAALIAVSKEEEREARALGFAADRVFLVPNGVRPISRLEPPVRERGVLQVGFFGRLTRQKGADLFVEAAAAVSGALPEVRFVLYGEGEEEATLRRQVARRGLDGVIRFGGAYAQQAAVEYMRQVDVVVVPSRWEGCPYVILEAMQAGVPVAAAAVGGAVDLIEDGVDGVLFAPGDTAALSRALDGLLRDPQARLRLALRGQERVGVRTVEAMAGSVAGVYRQVAGLCRKKRNAPAA